MFAIRDIYKPYFQIYLLFALLFMNIKVSEAHNDSDNNVLRKTYELKLLSRYLLFTLGPNSCRELTKKSLILFYRFVCKIHLSIHNYKYFYN